MAENTANDGERVADYAGGPGRTRETLGRAFLKAIAADFADGGRKAISIMREERPHDYVRLIAALVPKEFPNRDPSLEDLTDDELDLALNTIRSIIAASSPALDAGGGAKPDQAPADRG